MKADWSNLLGEIDVMFRILRFYLPDEDWSWNHPVLRQWMTERDFKNPYCMDWDDLVVVLRSLYTKFRKVRRGES